MTDTSALELQLSVTGEALDAAIANTMRATERAQKAEAALSTSYRQGLEDAAKVAWAQVAVSFNADDLVAQHAAIGANQMRDQIVAAIERLKDNPNG